VIEPVRGGGVDVEVVFGEDAVGCDGAFVPIEGVGASFGFVDVEAVFDVVGTTVEVPVSGVPFAVASIGLVATVVAGDEAPPPHAVRPRARAKRRREGRT